MENKLSGSARIESPVNYNYETIKMTQGRLDKGLIAFPVSLADKFPTQSGDIKIFIGDSADAQLKPFSSYSSRTHETRINGLRDWFRRDNIKNGDEIVIQFIDEKNHIYRLIKENDFINKTLELEQGLDNSNTDEEASGKIATLANWTKSEKNKVLYSELFRLSSGLPIVERRIVERKRRNALENIPAGIRMLLTEIYKGHCQVCDFTFLKKNHQPYFEAHHLNPHKGHHPKNLVVVCGNCHNEFENANVKQELDENAWLTKVAFNEIVHPVKQAVFDIKLNGFFKETFTL
jgi:hypothetical protein